MNKKVDKKVFKQYFQVVDYITSEEKTIVKNSKGNIISMQTLDNAKIILCIILRYVLR